VNSTLSSDRKSGSTTANTAYTAAIVAGIHSDSRSVGARAATVDPATRKATKDE